MMLPLIANTSAQLLGFGLMLIGIALALRGGLAYWRKNLSQQKFLVDRINRLLPQTQCGQCGYEGCLPYARAMAQGSAINQCPPGGAATIYRLSELLNEFPQALNPAHGNSEPAKVATIREDECIGCTKCIKACPVDAIVGGAKLMHTVISSECTGCDLCVDPCPVDCIDLLPSAAASTWHWPLPTELTSANSPADQHWESRA